MKTVLSRLFALALVLVIGLMNCSAASAANASEGLTGNYREDTLSLVNSLRTALELPDGTAEKSAAQSEARLLINDFASRYRRNGALIKLSSFTTMRTALNSLAGHYSSYPNRPVPEKLKTRLEQEFKQVESALRREG